MATISINDWPTRYGPGVIRWACGQVSDYVVLTSPSAWRAVADQFAHEPKAVEFVISQEQSEVDAMAARLPPAAHVVGAGGGMALDMAKYVAWKSGARLWLAPTIVSTGSVFQSGFPMRKQGKLDVIPQTVAPRAVLFDTEVIAAAPPHLNAAGMAECICWLAQIAAWRWWSDQGLAGKAWDQAAVDETESWVADCVAAYVDDLDGQGRPGPLAVRVCAEVNRQRHELKLAKLDVGHAIDHLFENTFTWVHGRHMLHAEGVALGTLINNALCGHGFAEARKLLDACGGRYLPQQIGCNWDEIESTLAAIPDHCDHLQWGTCILHHMSADCRALRRLIC